MYNGAIPIHYYEWTVFSKDIKFILLNVLYILGGTGPSGSEMRMPHLYFLL